MRIVPALCDRAIPLERRRWASGAVSLDAALAGGLAHGAVHEIYAAEVADAAAAAGFSAALMAGMTGQVRTSLWLRSRRAARQGGSLQASGWAELGGTPGRGLVGIVPDALTLLRAAVDALHCPTLGTVVAESWGRMPELDLTASRRLALAAEKSGTTLMLLRIEADPVPSAAETRWSVASAPSRALAANAPGIPTFDITLLRQRSGPSGMSWRLEWDRDQCIFRETALPGAVVPVSFGGPVADRAGGAMSQVA